MKEEKGFLYIAVGEKFLEETLISAKQLKNQMPDYPITLVTYREVEEDIFDEVKVVDELDEYSEKVVNMHIPYEKTIFLDMDTWVVEPIDELFDLLEQFDLAIAHNPTRNYSMGRENEVPKGFPQHNTGVMALRKNQRTEDLLEDWERRYKEPKETPEYDQISFREAHYHSDCRFTVLPPEYNCRYNWPGMVEGKVKIFHGKLVETTHGAGKRVDIKQAVEKINSSRQKRCHVLRSGEIKVYKKTFSPFYAFKKNIKEEGVVKTLIRAVKKAPEIVKTDKWKP
jgi:hypothetical protein